MQIQRFAGVRRFIRWVVTGEALAAADDQIAEKTGWRPSEAIKRGVGWLVAAGAWLVWSLIASWLPWLQDQNWAVWLVAGLGLAFFFALTLLLFAILGHVLRPLFLSRHGSKRKPRTAVATAESDGATQSLPSPTVEQEKAGNDLMLFFLDRILPAGLAQKELQEAMIRRVCGGGLVQDLAISGLRCRPQVTLFWRHFSRLWDAFTSSPRDEIPLHDMMHHVELRETMYHTFIAQGDEIAVMAGIDYRTDDDFRAYYEKWRSDHNRLVASYDLQVKRDARFPKLFRPGRESRWGGIIE